MKVATILLPCLLTGGTEVSTMGTVTALIALGFDVEVVVYFDEVEPAMLQSFQAAGTRVNLLGLVRGGGLTNSLKLAVGLLCALWGKRHTLIWVQYMTPTLVPLVVARLFSPRLFAAVHVAAGHYGAHGLRRLRWLARWWCTRFVCVSQTTAIGIFGEAFQGNALAKRVKIIPNSVDIVAVEAAPPHDWRRALGLKNDDVVVGYVGRLAHNKGVDVLLHAAALVTQRQADLHWVIVGEGAEQLGLMKLVADTGLEGVVHFVGSVSREGIYSAIKGFDIAVVPSREEGFGLTALEAMACGVPLVASRVDALKEVVQDGVTGLLFQVASSQSMADSVVHLVSDEQLRQHITAAGFDYARKYYDTLVYKRNIATLVECL